jgi:voltage-gated potassium channel
MTKTKASLDSIPWNTQTKDGQVLLNMPWEIFVLGVALLSIVNLALAVLVRNPDLDQIIAITDSIYIVIFLVDVLRRLRIAEDDRAYILHGWGWLDAISIIPLLRITRILRIVRVIRLVGRMGGPEAALRAFFANRAAGGLLLVMLIALVVLEYGSLAVLGAERQSESANILTAGDAIWYVVVTMSTVGYGDRFPVTEWGRIWGAAVIIVGVGVFGTLTGFLANAFLAPSKD